MKDQIKATKFTVSSAHGSREITFSALRDPEIKAWKVEDGRLIIYIGDEIITLKQDRRKFSGLYEGGGIELIAEDDFIQESRETESIQGQPIDTVEEGRSVAIISDQNFEKYDNIPNRMQFAKGLDKAFESDHQICIIATKPVTEGRIKKLLAALDDVPSRTLSVHETRFTQWDFFAMKLSIWNRVKKQLSNPRYNFYKNMELAGESQNLKQYYLEDENGEESK